MTATERRRLRVTGVVQGVGFRPYVHRLASGLALGGFVGNDAGGVFAEVEGSVGDLDAFVARLPVEAPPLARVESIETQRAVPRGDSAFSIVDSARADGVRTLVPPDVSVCDDCMDEVHDPADRRYGYPFANCTNCGPRFTIIRDLPYDRPATTMTDFALCPECASEYDDPTDRRYHAQPIACPQCGPQIAFEQAGATVVGTERVLEAVHRAIASGEIVAIKGIGGYHLACDATSDEAVGLLRERKGRVDKPFAVMAADLAAAAALAEIDQTEAAALLSPAKPIVLLRRRTEAPLSRLVAPGNPLIGVMLPYTPLHHLLLHRVGRPLVLTSGNRSNEPIAYDDLEARERLAGLADAFCTHDRPIEVPCDDSVVRVVGGDLQPIRRSRGYTPLPIDLPVDVVPTLAVGGELKNTFCLASGTKAWISQHIGDMENLETLDAYERSVDAFMRMYDVAPERIATDGHPGYLTRRWALGQPEPTVTVQHHHAHVAAAMAEHGLDGSAPVTGIAFDGTGYSPGGEIWGGEILVADYDGFSRVAHLRPMPLPGGDDGVRNPCRLAVAYLREADIALDPRLPAVAACEEAEVRVVSRQVDRNVGCAPTTSMGRLFDVVASLLGVRHRITYEAQAAIELEAVAEAGSGETWPVAFDRLDPRPLLRRLVEGQLRGVPQAHLARAFHDAVAAAIVDAAARAGRPTVALTGGVFQNALLTTSARQVLEDAGFEVLTHRLVPPNDGGLALGQAIVAGRRRG